MSSEKYTTLDFSEKDHYFMRLALEEAEAAGRGGEVPAGAVVVAPDGRLAGRGRNQVISRTDPTAHGEILALRQAAEAAGNYRLPGFTLFSTLEPCPMCFMAAVQARVARIVFGAPEPRWGAAGSLIDLAALEGLNHYPAMAGGLLAAECRELISSFFRRKRAAGGGG